MRRETSKLWAVLLLLVMTPGMVELSENIFHFMWQGHVAHGVADGDHHEPTDSEHGCTPGLHLCGCHSNMAYASSSMSPLAKLSESAFLPYADDILIATEFHLAVDRPPRA